MPSAREAEVAAEHFAHEQLEALRTRRALRTKWDKVDLLGADVQARLCDGSQALLQASKAKTRMADKRRALERLGGETIVPPQPWERRLVLLFDSLTHPEDARWRVHVFRVQELVEEADVDDGLEVDGRSRRPGDGLVWARWGTPVQIDRERGYRTDTM
jgi:hypothetical protein